MIRRGVKHLAVGVIDRDVGEAGVFVDKLHVVPGLTAVRSLVDAAFLVWSKQMAQHRDVDGVWILRIDHDAGDGLRVFQTHLRERLAGIG